MELLKDRGFTKIIIDNEDPVISVKMLSYVMSHSILKPQRLLMDDDDYYVAIDMYTNTYYICYRDLMMIDIDRYKSKDETIDVLDDIKTKLSKYPELFFRIFSSRNGYHIFVLNRSMDYKSDESIRLMYELGCDFYYIVYSYLRGWSVRLNKKKGEETVDNLYSWIGDMVRGYFFSSEICLQLTSDITKIQDLKIEKSVTQKNDDIQTVDLIPVDDILPDHRLESLADFHIELTDIFKNVGLCTMSAPTIGSSVKTLNQ
jgi:hypothetical protein